MTLEATSSWVNLEIADNFIIPLEPGKANIAKYLLASENQLLKYSSQTTLLNIVPKVKGYDHKCILNEDHRFNTKVKRIGQNNRKQSTQ